MNRKELDKLCFSYADGESDADQRARAESLLESDLEFSAMLEADRRLKASLARSFKREIAPAGLAHRALASLPRTEHAPRGQDHWAARIIPLGLVTAAAASIVLWLGIPEQDTPRTAPVIAGIPARVESLHMRCSAMGAFHHAADLPRDDLQAIREIMSSKLKLAVLAPDLSAEGMEFTGADYCGLNQEPGAHLLYEDNTDLFVSVLTVRDMKRQFECCPNVRRETLAGREYDVLLGQKCSALAWHADGATYLICGEMDKTELLVLSEPVRIALEAGVLDCLPGVPEEIRLTLMD